MLSLGECRGPGGQERGDAEDASGGVRGWVEQESAAGAKDRAQEKSETESQKMGENIAFRIQTDQSEEQGGGKRSAPDPLPRRIMPLENGLGAQHSEGSHHHARSAETLVWWRAQKRLHRV